MIQKVSLKVGQEELVLETNRMAKQANGAVFATYGGSSVLATVCCAPPRAQIDYFPMSVEYNEKGYAAGVIPGSRYIRREGRPKDREILVSRQIDRPMRPLFPKGFQMDVQIIPTVVATDKINPPEIVAMVAASAAVTLSDIPFDGPVGAVRVGYVDSELVINPTYEQLERATLDIVVAGTAEGVTMVEGGGEEISEELMIQAIEKAQDTIRALCDIQLELARLAGKTKMVVESVDPSDGAVSAAEAVSSAARESYAEACFVKGKMERSQAMREIRSKFAQEYADRLDDESKGLVNQSFAKLEYDTVRASILDRATRSDGRSPEDIRPITCEVGVLPRTHGSALFTRGETQALGVLTLGTDRDEQLLSDIQGEHKKHFMLHYNFPPFSVGETGRLGPGRRDIGHGHLAERALEGMLPDKEGFPYTIRVVSEVLESNGSSSMATVCAGALSLMDGGVPLARPVAGIAMGLVSDGDRYVVLSDILGEEDHLGDMDFKVAGTAEGITAFQMDIKIKSVSPEILQAALRQARDGRLQILKTMATALDKPRAEVSEYAPKVVSMRIDTEKIGAVIGPGGKSIKSITEKTGATVNIEDDGTVNIFSADPAGADEAVKIIKGIVEDPEVGSEYDGVVKRIMDFGAFIEILPGKEGLCHISKLSDEHVERVTDVVTEGKKVRVRVIEIDRMGRINLSLAHVSASPSRRPPPRDQGPRDSSRGGDRGRSGPPRGSSDSGGRGDRRPSR